MTRDPRTDPQQGDELRGPDYIRRVIRRKGDMLLINTGTKRYHMHLDRWREWWERNGAELAQAERLEINRVATKEEEHAHISMISLVGAGRFEPPTPCAQGRFGTSRKSPISKLFCFKLMPGTC